MGRHGLIPDSKYQEYAMELLKKDINESIPKVAARVFGISLSHARKKAWEYKKHAAFIAEHHRLVELQKDEDPMDKDLKLAMNKVLLDEAYRERDHDTYTKLMRIDNDMQGHTKSAEQVDDKQKIEGSLISELIGQLREKNRKKIQDAIPVSEEVIELQE